MDLQETKLHDIILEIAVKILPLSELTLELERSAFPLIKGFNETQLTAFRANSGLLVNMAEDLAEEIFFLGSTKEEMIEMLTIDWLDDTLKEILSS